MCAVCVCVCVGVCVGVCVCVGKLKRLRVGHVDAFNRQWVVQGGAGGRSFLQSDCRYGARMEIYVAYFCA